MRRIALPVALVVAVLSACATGEHETNANGPVESTAPARESVSRNQGPGNRSASSTATVRTRSTVRTEVGRSPTPSAIDPELSAFEKTCAERVEAARDGSDKERAAQRECGLQGPDKGIPFGRDVGNETRTLSDVRAWWTVSGLLRSHDLTDEAVVVTSHDGMAATDPMNDLAAVTFVYEKPPVSVANATYFALIDSGARTVRTAHFPPGSFDPKTIEGGRPVTVRGTQQAFLKRLEKGSSANVNWLTIRWVEQPRRGSGAIFRELGFHSMTTTDAAAIAFANSLENP